MKDKMRACEIMFEKCEVDGLFITNTCPLTLTDHGIETGTVIDIGDGIC